MKCGTIDRREALTNEPDDQGVRYCWRAEEDGEEIGGVSGGRGGVGTEERFQ